MDVIISSPAVRAITTALIISQHIMYPADQILLRNQLYDSSFKDYLNSIRDLKEGDQVMLAGHNNTISEFAQRLLMSNVNELKTCAIVAIRFNIMSWQEIAEKNGELLWELHPAAIKTV
jgi:phosphohistidine phosphatase